MAETAVVTVAVTDTVPAVVAVAVTDTVPAVVAVNVCFVCVVVLRVRHANGNQNLSCAAGAAGDRVRTLTRSDERHSQHRPPQGGAPAHLEGCGMLPFSV